LEYEAIEAVFGSEERNLRRCLDENEFPLGSDERQRALEQAAMLRAADVIVLNEVDLGMKRTELSQHRRRFSRAVENELRFRRAVRRTQSGSFESGKKRARAGRKGIFRNYQS
jgi:hypothetical protein